MATETRSRKKKIIPEMLPKTDKLREEHAAAYLQLSLSQFQKNAVKEGLKIYYSFGVKFYSAKQIDEVIENSIIYNPSL